MQNIDTSLVSCWDKSGLEDLVEKLVENEVKIIATRGTASFIEDMGYDVDLVSEYTGRGEMLDGRVKSLHPKIYAGILARSDCAEDLKQLQKENIEKIDLVVCNLYPFSSSLKENPGDEEKAAEMIDIGGVSLLRAAAKNHSRVMVLSHPDQYEKFLDRLQEEKIGEGYREQLAREAFARTSEYDMDIATNFPSWRQNEKSLPRYKFLAGEKKIELKYGENPHQNAAVYENRGSFSSSGEKGLLGAEQLNGDVLSYNNMKDAAAAMDVIQEFSASPAAVIIKHTNPCGLARASSPVVAFRRAYAGDPQSAYGGIAGLNREVNASTAREMAGGRKFLDVIVAPDFSEEAVDILRERWDDVKLLSVGDIGADRSEKEVTAIPGGFLLQDRDERNVTPEDLELVVGEGELTDDEVEDLIFAWKAVKHVKSNAIALARDGALVGVGAGQMSRIDAIHIAGRKASGRQRGGVLASDAFFPFPDAIEMADELGIKLIIQPGGSIRDAEVKNACKKAGIRMVFTGVRHFLH